jgi:hypothetical protein
MGELGAAPVIRVLLGVRPLIIGKPAPNDGGGGFETIPAIPQTGVQEFLLCVYGNKPRKRAPTRTQPLPPFTRARAREDRDIGQICKASV